MVFLFELNVFCVFCAFLWLYFLNLFVAGEVRKDLLPYLFAWAGLSVTKYKVVSYDSRDFHRLVAEQRW